MPTRFDKWRPCRFPEIELFQLLEPTVAKPSDDFAFSQAGIFHFCVADPDVSALVTRIVENGGRPHPVMRETSNHTVFQSDKIQSLLRRLHAEASAADEPFFSKFSTMPVAERKALQDDDRRFYGSAREAYIPVAEEFGRPLYLMAGATRARTIVDFGTSFGISTIYVASALRDNGGGNLITCEIEANKSQRAQTHLAEAGLSDLVEFRIGDALEVLNEGITAPVDMLLLDGAKATVFSSPETELSPS